MSLVRRKENGFVIINGNLISASECSGAVRIPEGAFWRCKSLTQITLPKNLKEIGEVAFQNCTALTNVAVSSNVKTVNRAAFENCSAKLIIHGISNSYIQSYAEQNSITFKSIAINKTKLTLSVGGCIRLSIGGVNRLSWTSSDSSIATINKYGGLTAKKKGTVTITGKLYGKTYTCKVTVK